LTLSPAVIKVQNAAKVFRVKKVKKMQKHWWKRILT